MYPKDVAKMSPCASLKCSPDAPTIDGKGANFGNRKENPRGKTSGQSGAFLKGLERERNERICVPLPARQRGIFETRPKWYKPLDKLGVVITLTPFMCHNSERIRARNGLVYRDQLTENGAKNALRKRHKTRRASSIFARRFTPWHVPFTAAQMIICNSFLCSAARRFHAPARRKTGTRSARAM